MHGGSGGGMLRMLQRGMHVGKCDDRGKDDANVMKARTVGEESGSNGAGRKRTEIQEEETENQERSRTGVQGRMHANSWSRTQVQERTGRNPTSEGAVKISRGGIECCVVWTVCVENVLNAWD